jgi:hypothetical protein
MVAVVRRRKSCHIRNVFRQRLLAIDGKIREGFVCVILRGQPCGRFFEMLQIRVGPPIAHTSLCIKRAAFRIKRVADFVSDHRSDRPVIHRVGRLGIKKRWLQDRCRKIQRILQRQIHRIHRLRRHRPFFPVHRLAQSRQIALISEHSSAPHIPVNIVGLHFVPGIVLPTFRIAHAHIQRRQLGLRLRLCFGIHPRQCIDAFAERRDQLCHHRLRPRFRFRREIALRIDFPHVVA